MGNILENIDSKDTDEDRRIILRFISGRLVLWWEINDVGS
jgi:hypothetical protein